jgi:S1-C subfamily serine protease
MVLVIDKLRSGGRDPMKPSTRAGQSGAAFYLIVVVLLAAVLQGCAPQPTATNAATAPITNISNYKINGVDYSSEPAAMSARKAMFDNMVAQVATEADPIKGRALIILPDHDRLRPFVAQQSTAALKRVVTGAALEALVDEEQQNLRQLSDALVKNGTFQTITVEERNDVVNLPATDTDFLIAFQVRTLLPNNTGLWLGGWIVRRVGAPRALGASMDPGTPAGAPRLASFIKNVREDALRLGGTSVGGTTAASLPAANGLPVVTSGSGIVVDKQGEIVTNAHVVSACTDPIVIDASNIHHPAHIVTKDEANDLALLKTDHHWPQAVSFRDGSEIRVGDNVFAVGYPLTGLVTSSIVVTTGSVNAIAGPRDDSRLLQISAPVQPGNSGGPLLDKSGHLIGIVTSELNGALLTLLAGISPQNVNFALKSVIVRNFLEAQSVDFAHAQSTQEMSAADVSALARKITVRVQCGG